MKIGIAGTLESNDVMITVKESDQLHITINSIVDAFFHEQIHEVIVSTLKDLEITSLDILCEDKGALDYTIKARLITAIQRMR